MIDFVGAYQDRNDCIQKYVFKDKNGVIEVSHIHNKDRDTYCIPSMYMCRLGCKFCHCTTENLPGKMEPIAYDTIKEILSRIPRTKPSILYSVMGMGDPMMNTPLVIRLNNECKDNERVSISTIFPSGSSVCDPDFVPNGVKVHYSLHNPIEEKRKELIPCPTHSIEDVLASLSNRPNLKKEIHYTLIDGVNDTIDELREMTRLSVDYGISIKFLAFNETGNFKKSKNLGVWMNALGDIVNVEFYTPPGLNIGSSCGQFTKYFYNNTNNKEFEEFEKKYRLF